jgi:hypothetical protein
MNDLQPVEDQEIQIIQGDGPIASEILAITPVGINTSFF